MSDIIIAVENLSKRYLVGHRSAQRESYTALRDVIGREVRNFALKAVDFVRGQQIVQGDEVEEFWALRDVNFEVKRGEVLGIIGRNGAGKSTLLKILSRITEPDRGRAILRGRVASLLEVGTGFHGELTGRENIYLNGAILGMTRREIARKFDEIVAFSGVEKFLDTPVKRFSSGMYVRLAFAVAAHLEPEILIVDEVLAVGDIEFQRKCLGQMQEAGRSGRTVLFVSHNMAAIHSLTSRSIVLSQGNLIFDGNTDLAVKSYVDTFDRAAEGGRSRGKGTHTAIKRVQLIDEHSVATNQYLPGTPLRVELSVWTDGSPNLSIELILVGEDQQKLAFASLHQFAGISLPTSAGDYELVLEIEPIWIASGPYSLDVTTSVVNVAWDHYIERAIGFEVIASNPGNRSWDFKQSFGHGAFAMKCLRPPDFKRL
jgi:lipopolysaccharide transport system ATP-binding protein